MYLRLLLIVILLGVSLVVGDVFSSPSLEKTKTELNEIYKKMEEKKKYIQVLKTKEKEMKGKLSLLNKETKAKKREIALIDDKIKIIRQNLDKLKYELFQIQRQLILQDKILQDNIRILYEYYHSDLSNPFVNDDIFEYLEKVALKNNKIYNEFINKKDIILYDKRSQEEIYSQNLNNKKLAEAALSKINKEHDQYRQELIYLSKEKRRYEREIRELKLASLKLEKLLVTLSSKKKSGKTVPAALALAGRNLLFPVEGGTIKQGYGKYKHHKFNTTLFNKGIDIAVPYGSKVRAVDAGKVVYADYFKGYGKLVVIDHGLGLYSIYAYLDKILVTTGRGVKKGEVIGQVGEPMGDSLSNLHFGLRIKGEAINPLAYISR